MSDNPQNSQLEAFLSAGTPTEQVDPPQSAPPSQPQQAAEPEPKSPPPSKPKAGEAPRPDAASTKAQPEDADDGEQDDGSGTVPLAAFRKQREDYKMRAARAEGELAAMRAELEAIRARASQPAQPPAQQAGTAIPPPPDPRHDPVGYSSWIQAQITNQTLNTSEILLRRQIGDEAVDKLVTDFTAAAQQDPSLWDKLHAQRDPYQWAHKQMQQQALLRDVGADPDAYRAKLRAEIEAEIRAQQGQGQPTAPPPSPVAGLPPSLANVRSSAPRGQTFSGPPAIEDLVGRRSGDLFQRRG